MGLFGNSKDAALYAEVERLAGEISRLADELRAVKLEWAETSDRVYRWMRRGEVAARRAEAAAQTATPEEPPAIPADTPLRTASRRALRASGLWGARGRRQLRQTTMGAPVDEAPEEGESANGVHS